MKRKRQVEAPSPTVDSLPEDERLLRIREVSDYLGISPSTIRRFVKAGVFPLPRALGGQHRWRVREIREYNRSVPAANIKRAPVP